MTALLVAGLGIKGVDVLAAQLFLDQVPVGLGFVRAPDGQELLVELALCTMK